MGDGSDLGKSEGRSGEAFDDLGVGVCFDVGEGGVCARWRFDAEGVLVETVGLSEPAGWLPVMLGLVAGDDEFFLAFDLVIIEIARMWGWTGIDSFSCCCRKDAQRTRRKKKEKKKRKGSLRGREMQRKGGKGRMERKVD